MTRERPKGFVGFLREAKRRKVYVAVVAYVGVSIGLIEITGAVAEALLFPDWTTRLVTFLLILGFPVVLVLSWIFDFTGQGWVRTSDQDLEEGATTAGRGRQSGAMRVATPAKGGGAGMTPGSLRRAGAPGKAAPMPAPRRRKPIPGADSVEGGEGSEEEALDPERVRRATLAHVRHELRTPINGIIGYSEMLLEDVEDEAFTGDLRKVLAGGRQLLVLIDQLLGDGSAGDNTRELESYAEQIQVDLRTPVTSVVGYAEILLETAQEEGREDLVPDMERVHTAAHRLLDLSGDIVGLATKGGMADSVEGSEASDLTRAVLSKIQPARASGAGEGEGRLLVVDDNAGNRDLLSRQLARQGYIVLTASDGMEALELLGSQSVDLILLDVIMPRMDGVETLNRLKSDAKLADIPVLMLSSLDEVDGALRCIEMGAEDYLSKPVRPAILEARITANLELHRMRERERVYQERVAADGEFIQGLLLSAFPEGLVERVKSGEVDLADVVPEATVLTCKLRGLTTPNTSGELRERLLGLREISAAVESLVRDHEVETCIWRPDGFVAVAGAPSPTEDHLQRGADLARAVLAHAGTLAALESGGLRMGLGLHTGPVVAAAIGGERLRYDIWGEGVRTSEGVAGAAPDGSLLASPPVYARLKEAFTFEAQKVREVAGVQMRTYLLQ